MRSILILLNLMLFFVICTILFIKSGNGEEMIKRAVKDTIREIVQEEIKKQIPKIPNWWEKK